MNNFYVYESFHCLFWTRLWLGMGKIFIEASWYG